VDLDRSIASSLDDRQLLWIDLDNRERHRLQTVLDAIDTPVAIDSMTEEAGKARLIRHGDFIHLTVLSVESGDDGLRRKEVGLLAGPNIVVTLHDGPVSAIADFDDLIKGDTLLGELDSASFVAALVDSVLSSYFARIEEVEQAIDRLDDLALRGHDSDRFMVEVLQLRRQIAVMRRTIAPHREAFAPLARADFGLDERISKRWPPLIDRLERVIDSIENARELLVGSFDIYLGGAAQRTNDVMKALTVLSAVLLPAVVLAGIMGMNFQMWFFQDTSYFWWVLGGMGIFAVSLLAFARYRHWI
jgi:magnesium/cobalt transport protein CorA